MIPLYILGLLQRFGPQHGYQIRKIIAEQLSDFTQIKLPTIYYHLEKMAADGLLHADCEKSGSRPEKTVYSVTDKGKQEFISLLEQQLEFGYRPEFPCDGAFYFSEYLDAAHIAGHLSTYRAKLEDSIRLIEKHRTESMAFIPEQNRPMAGVIFSHHLTHYKAELAWVTETLSVIKGDTRYDTEKNTRN
jgi:DNA-binding PadR family transcriptional regulator